MAGDVIVFLPGDMESDPATDIPLLLGKMAEGYDVVAGWRQGRNDRKVLASRIYNWVSGRLFGVRAHDMNWIRPSAGRSSRPCRRCAQTGTASCS